MVAPDTVACSEGAVDYYRVTPYPSSGMVALTAVTNHPDAVPALTGSLSPVQVLQLCRLLLLALLGEGMERAER